MASTAPSMRKAVPRSAGLPGGRLYDAADALAWIAGLNLLIVAFTLLGAVVVGLAPALVAAVTVSRARLRGDQQPLVRTFARTWRRELVGANVLLTPFVVLGTLLAVNLLALAPGNGPLEWALVAALAVVVLAATFALTMSCHYEIPRSRSALLAVRYLLHDLPGASLVLAVTALAVVGTWFVPGLAPVLTVGAWVYAVTAISLSLFTRNDELVAAEPPPSGPLPAPTKGTR